MKKIIIAPVSKNNQEALDNYQHEMEEASKFQLCMWDGEVNGKEETGDYFGFVDVVNDTVEVTKVLAVLGPTAGRRMWNNPGLQGSGKLKNVLVLDSFYKTISYSKFKKDAGYKPNLVLSGTKRLDWPY